MKCGEKWGRNHKCPEKVALHVLEEVMEAVQPDTTTEEVSDTTTEDSSDEKQVFALSNFVAAEVQGKKTIKLTGLVNNQQILILIDSGSSCTFISEKAVDTLRLAVTLHQFL
jgi:predicted aspartyl protease